MSGAVVEDGAIPPGEYRLKYLGYRIAVGWGVPRVVVRFSVLDYGEHFETQIERFYRVKEIKGRPRKKGSFVVGKRSDLYREFTRFRNVSRGDRISFDCLSGRVVIGRVRTVTQDQNQKALPEDAHYSVVDELLCFERE